MTVAFKVGDCGVRLKEIPESSIDCMVTDPPYGYSFMGKDWDKVVIGPEIWKECLRVLKPGAFAFVMSAPRQDVLSRMMINLENAGFETGFTSIYWAYATGFPKGMNMSKAIDKREGKEPTKIKEKDYTGPEFADKQFKEQGSMMQTHETAPRIQQWETEPTTEKAKKMDGSYAGYQPKPAVEVIIVCMKPLSEGNYVNQAMENRKGVTWLNDCRIPYRDKKDIGDPDRGKGYPLLDEKKGWNQNNLVNNITIGEKGRYPSNLIASDSVLDIGKETKSPSGTVNRKKREGSVFTGSSCGFDSENQHESGYGDKGDFSRYFDLDKWEPEGRYPANLIVSDDVFKDFQDKGTKPHPLTSKPETNERSKEKGWGSIVQPKKTIGNYGDAGSFSRYFDLDKWADGQQGKYPSNLLVSDESLNDGKVHKSGKMDQDVEGKQFNTYGKMYDRHVKSEGGSGTFSRFFDVDRWWANFIVTPKASQAEKNKGLDGFKEKDNDRTNQNWKCKKCGKFQLQGKGDICKCENPDWERGKSRNNHPTVKPLKLMSYLITLGSRPNDTILDPFSGSGTTCLAANILGRNAIGIELNPEYAKIAKARLEGWY